MICPYNYSRWKKVESLILFSSGCCKFRLRKPHPLILRRHRATSRTATPSSPAFSSPPSGVCRPLEATLGHKASFLRGFFKRSRCMFCFFLRFTVVFLCAGRIISLPPSSKFKTVSRVCESNPLFRTIHDFDILMRIALLFAEAANGHLSSHGHLSLQGLVWPTLDSPPPISVY